MRRLTYLTLYIILLGVVFFGLSDKIIYHNNQDLVSWLPFILLFPVQALLVYCLAKAFGATNLYAKGIVGLAILITGPAFGFYIKNKQQKELSKNGSQTIGVVFKKWKAHKRYGEDYCLVRCKFQVDGKTYLTFSEDDLKNQYKVGDTLHVVYSVDNPENCIITELKK